MKRFASALIVFFHLSGCVVTSWSPSQILAASDTSLCSTFAHVLRYQDYYRTDLMNEIQRRNLIRPEFKASIEAGNAQIGMTPIEAVCAWAAPTRINTTTTEAGSSEQWVYQYGTAIGRPRLYFLYFRGNRLTAIQE